MRARMIILVLAILLVAGFAALNWSEVIRPAPLMFGPVVMDAPMGAILLGLLALAVIAFVLWAGGLRTQTLIDTRNHHKALETQRELAEKAEASRFTDLRQHLDNHLRETRERDAIAASEFDRARVETQRELRTQMDQISRMIAARMNELEHRLEARFERMGLPSMPMGTAMRPETAPGRDVIAQSEPVRMDVPEQAQAQQEREERLRAQAQQADERMREQRERELRDERARAADKPAESGWRKWF